LQILFTVGAQTSGTWTIGNVQLEPGSVATPYERQIYSDQMAQCQRYYETNTTVAANASSYVNVQWVVQKRAIPTVTNTTITFSSPVASTFSWYGLNSGGISGFAITASAEL